MRSLVLSLLVSLGAAAPALAAPWERLGTARVFTNDALGDLSDRWRTGAYGIGFFRGRDAWPGSLPGVPGRVLEWRIRGENVAPARLDAPEPGDRRYAAMLSLGLHTYWQYGRTEARAGAELVFTGPQTHLDDLQSRLHDVLSVPVPDLSNQIGNAMYPTLSVEAGRTFTLGNATVRPFVEAQAGVESFGRVGVDVVLGSHGRGGLLMRDPVTGHRVTAVRGAGTAGFSLVLGADTAQVRDSRLLPDGGDAVAERRRHRVRVGGHWAGGAAEVFYGIAWLSPEFRAQDEGQVVGALNLRLPF